MLEPVDAAATDDYQIVDIPSGANAEIIAVILEDENLIQNEMVFRYYVRQHNLGQGFMAGRYQLSPSMSLQQIIEKLTTGDSYSETAWFTIPEGLRIEEIAAKLAEEGLVNSDRFLELARQPGSDLLEEFPYLQDVGNSDIEYHLEGYLFPDTYEVYTDASEEAIIRIMLHSMDSIINDPEHKERIEELDYNLHQVLTLASLVEREAAVDQERPRIAGVIYNRLEIGQLLQIDATIQYILGETKEFLLYSDLEIPSPYNTYQHTGLPPGPIAAPGKLSIEAALYPEDTDYFFYNYKYDGTGEHYFSHTYAEHLENVRIAEENIQ